MRYTQPQHGPLQIDWSNPITKGLIAVFDMTGPVPREIITGYRSSLTTNYTQSVSKGGKSLKRSAVGADGTKTFLGASPHSAVVVSAPLSAASTRPFFSQRPSGGGGQYTFAANMDTGFGVSSGALTMSTNGSITLTAAGAITGSLAVYGYSLVSSSTGQLYVNGSAISTTVGGSGYPTIGTPDFNLMYHGGAAVINDTDTTYLCLWDRALSSAEHASLAANPWQVILDEEEETEGLFPVSAGGPQSYSYTATGGAVFSGDATKLRGTIKSAAGGLSFSGTSAQNRGVVRAPTGGIVFGGTNTPIRSLVKAATGGILFSGAATVSFSSAVQSFVYTATGGITFSGAATKLRSVVRAATGGILFGGAASVTEFPDPNPASSRGRKRTRHPRWRNY